MQQKMTPAEKMVSARIDFIFKDCAFLGNLALRLKLIECEWLPTAGTDGVHLYYNPDFVGKLDSNEVKFVVGHEVMHGVYEHFFRQMGRDADRWNRAGDYVINLELDDLRIGAMPKNEKFFNEEWRNEHPEKAKELGSQPIGLIDEKYRNMSSEQVYEALEEEDKQNGGQGKGSSFDIHISPDGKNCPGGLKPDPTGKTGPIPLTKEQVQRLPEEIRRAVQDAAKVAEGLGGSAGRLPGGVKRLIDEWNDSQMDWREYIAAKIQSIIRSDYTWARQSRKSQGAGYYLPGMLNDEEVSVDCAIDTSGSMTDQMLMDFLGEVKGIMEQFTAFSLRVWCFDTQTYTVHKFTQDNIDELDEFELEGFGGTLFECNWVMMKEEEIVPDQFIMFTDGYPCDGWGDEDYCDTLFIVHGSKEIRAPYGTTVHYDREAEAAARNGR